jgi:hypothetical protein
MKRDLLAVMRVNELAAPSHFEPHWRCVEERGRVGSSTHVLALIGTALHRTYRILEAPLL